MSDITMPKLADSMQDGTISRWLVSDGSVVGEGDELVEIETDKSVSVYQAERSGTLRIVQAAGERCAVGQVIAAIETGSPSASDATPDRSVPAPAVSTEAVSTEAVPIAAVPIAAVPIAAVSTEDRAATVGLLATPLSRRIAAARGLDLGTVRGTGPRGKIMRRDVDPPTESPSVHSASSAVPTPSTRGPEPIERVVPQSGGSLDEARAARLRTVIATRMVEAKSTIPHFQVQSEVEVDAILELRATLKAASGISVVPSLNDFVIRACALALREHPRVNARWVDGGVETRDRIDVGCAIAAPDALYVGNVAGADARTLGSIADQVRQMGARAQAGTLTSEDLADGTFTVSNLGMFGVTAMFPIINPGQSAILGVGAARRVLRLVDGEPVERHDLTLTLSCDHRTVYGADAARFLATVSSLLQNPMGVMV